MMVSLAYRLLLRKQALVAYLLTQVHFKLAKEVGEARVLAQYQESKLKHLILELVSVAQLVHEGS